MGRARASMQLIEKPKTRRVTCEKRGECLKKKATELSELCDVDVCLIMYPPGGEGGAAAEPPKIWPENPEKIHNLMKLFNSMRADEKRCQFYTVATYFDDRKRKAQGELDKLRKKARGVRYQTSIEDLPEETMRDLDRSLTAKIDEVQRRIDDMHRVHTSSNNNFSNLLAPSSSFGRSIQHQYPIFHQYPPMNVIPTNSFSQMMLEAAGEQFGGNVVSRSYNNTNAILAPQLGYNVGYNMGLPAMNGYAWTESFSVLGTSSVSDFKMDKKEAPYFHI